jgi:hypothetical protein
VGSPFAVSEVDFVANLKAKKSIRFRIAAGTGEVRMPMGRSLRPCKYRRLSSDRFQEEYLLEGNFVRTLLCQMQRNTEMER